MRAGRLLALGSPTQLKDQALPGLAWDLHLPAEDPSASLLPVLGALNQAPGVLQAGLSGDRLRVIGMPDTSTPDLRQILQGLGFPAVTVQAVEPSLEDVFLALAK